MSDAGLAAMVGATLLVGVTYRNEDGSVGHVVEFAGVVTSVDPLVSIDTGDAEPFTLPPDPDAYQVAQPGEYHLRSTREIVVNPDFTSVWDVEAPEPSDD